MKTERMGAARIEQNIRNRLNETLTEVKELRVLYWQRQDDCNRLHAENAELRAALQEFVTWADAEHDYSMPVEQARAALAKAGE